MACLYAKVAQYRRINEEIENGIKMLFDDFEEGFEPDKDIDDIDSGYTVNMAKL